jgi:hypothetical protein
MVLVWFGGGTVWFEGPRGRELDRPGEENRPADVHFGCWLGVRYVLYDLALRKRLRLDEWVHTLKW